MKNTQNGLQLVGSDKAVVSNFEGLKIALADEQITLIEIAGKIDCANNIVIIPEGKKIIGRKNSVLTEKPSQLCFEVVGGKGGIEMCRKSSLCNVTVNYIVKDMGERNWMAAIHACEGGNVYCQDLDLMVGSEKRILYKSCVGINVGGMEDTVVFTGNNMIRSHNDETQVFGIVGGFTRPEGYVEILGDLNFQVQGPGSTPQLRVLRKE